ncbi:MAG: GGDEF domain-containing protein [Pseudomonadales bacterium]|nr:GGDEF domain-containing protein [Pseudomonadales bacterium]
MTRSKDRSPWRQKYLELVQEHDQVKQQLREREDLLRRGLSKITIAAKGQDVALDAGIDDFKQAINEADNQALESQIKKLDDSIHYFDQHRVERNVNLAEALVETLQRFQILTICDADNRQINQFIKQLLRASKNSLELFDLDLWLEKSNSIQASIVEDQLSDGLAIEFEQDALADPSKAVFNQQQTENSPFSIIKQATQAQALPAEIVSTLLAMLAEMDIPAEAEQFNAPLYHQLQNGLDFDNLSVTLNRFAVILSATLSRDQREFNSFLQLLDDEAEVLSAYLTFSEQNQKFSEQQLDNFVKQLNARLDSLDINSSVDIINHELRHISFLLEDFRLDQFELKAQYKQRVSAAKYALGEVLSRLDSAVVDVQQRREKLLRDKLTGLPNNDAYSLRIQQEFDRWQRYQRPLTIVAVNIDKLKELNQSYGYHSGDRIIQVVAQKLQENIRKTDFIARAMSSDFVLLLPELSEEQGVFVLDKFSNSLRECDFGFIGQSLVTLSLGAAELKSGDNINSIIRRAEKALSIALSMGGNCSHFSN